MSLKANVKRSVTSTWTAAIGSAFVVSLCVGHARPAQAQSMGAPCTTLSDFHLLAGSVPMSPAGQFLSIGGTHASGFYPTLVLGATPSTWYTDPLTGNLNNGYYQLVLWTNHPGAPSPVMAVLGVSNADGSGFRQIAVSSLFDVDSTGTGNHTTDMNLHVLAPQTLTNQRLVVSLTYVGGSGDAAPTMVYNGGVDFNTYLQTTGGCVTVGENTSNSSDLKSAQISETYPNTNYGGDSTVTVDSTDQGLFGYSLSIPSTATIVSASLEIPSAFVPGAIFQGDLAEVNNSSSWLQATVDWNLRPATTNLNIDFTVLPGYGNQSSASVDVTSAVTSAFWSGATQISFDVLATTGDIQIAAPKTSLQIVWR
jgi:hypothetical protein